MSVSCATVPAPNELHLWFFDMDAAAGSIDRLLLLLSVDECARSDRLILPVVRNRFIAARGILRTILGAAVSLPPRELLFGYGPHGKPELLNSEAAGLHFNLSHSGSMALLALSRSHPVGVDIERIRCGRPFLRLSHRFFSESEAAELAALSEDDIMDGFYACWTRKEAYLKAIGTGLATPLNAFDVTLKPGEPPTLYGQRLDPFETGRWRIYEVETEPGYRAAVATGWQTPEIITRRWHIARPFLS